MDRKVKFVVVLALAAVNAGVIPAPKVLEGPSSKTTIVGPDGSKISAFAPGGKIVLDETVGPLLQGAPEVIAVAGVAQPVPVTQTEVVREIIPVVEAKSEEDTVSVEAIPAVSVEGVDLGRSANTESIPQVEATTSIAEIAEEATNESLESTEEKVTDSPFSVAPLAKEVETVAVKAVDPQPLVAYIHDTPLYVPEVRQFSGEYIPEHLYDGEYLGW